MPEMCQNEPLCQIFPQKIGCSLLLPNHFETRDFLLINSCLPLVPTKMHNFMHTEGRKHAVRPSVQRWCILSLAITLKEAGHSATTLVSRQNCRIWGCEAMDKNWVIIQDEREVVQRSGRNGAVRGEGFQRSQKDDLCCTILWHPLYKFLCKNYGRERKTRRLYFARQSQTYGNSE